jgi:hypothetical protein
MVQPNRAYENEAAPDWLTLANLLEWERVDIEGRAVVS